MTDLTVLQQKMQEHSCLCQVKYNEPMRKHTSFRIGGNAEIMVFPKSKEELAQILQLSHLLDCKLRILGAGTNVLAPDEGLEGIVICLKDCLDGLEQIDDTHIRVAAGVTMTRAAVFAANLGLSGLEFAHGIPGSVGGGVYMNAGAYGGEICQVCHQVEIMDLTGKLCVLTNEQMQFSYRHSILEKEDAVVVSAVFSLIPKSSEEIKAKMRELMARRSASQPLELPSAGSAFKRPQGAYAAALIEQSGLKGFTVGNAAISEKHAGFAVNLGNATAKDVTELLQTVSDRVFAQSGIRLEPEIRIWK